MKIQAIKGMKDTLPGEVETWQEVESEARNVFEAYGFSEIRPPLLEKTELFARGIGEATDIVEKEMYTFRDKNDLSLTLRPEATAGIMRTYLENNLHKAEPFQKFYCIGPMFRYEKPQKGRYRQFHQIDAEIIGSADARVDAELLAMLRTFFNNLGLTELDFQVNSLGCAECRPSFREGVLGYLSGREDELCEDCQRRRTVNPLRIYDCKSEGCKKVIEGAPMILDFLCPECREHLKVLEEHLKLLELPYNLNPLIVRGLDYYTRTAFEVLSSDLGAQNAVCGGGRYDRLSETVGGPHMPATGFAIGEERLVSILMEKGRGGKRTFDLFAAVMGKDAEREAFLWVEKARKKGLRAEMDYRGASLKAQFRKADKFGAKRVLVLGEDELKSGKATVRNMTKGDQTEVLLSALEDEMALWAKEDDETHG